MIKVLIVKTSSMGDIIHTFPAVYELKQNIKNIQIDWVVEQNFVDLVKINKNIDNIITVDTRKWRNNWFKNLGNIVKFIKKLRSKKYDYVIDAQGLYKSLIITKLSKVCNKKKIGFDKNSIRGKYLSWLYNEKISVIKDQHAIYRIQELFGKVFSYKPLKQNTAEYGIEVNNFTYSNQAKISTFSKTIMLIPNTTWNSKKWPVDNWIELGNSLLSNNYQIIINSGNDLEYCDAVYIKNNLNNKKHVSILKDKSITDKINIIKTCSIIVSVDTGLAHIAAALDKTTITIYGATSEKLTGVKGQYTHNLTPSSAIYSCTPCFKKSCNYYGTEMNKQCYKDITSRELIDLISKISVSKETAQPSLHY